MVNYSKLTAMAPGWGLAALLTFPGSVFAQALSTAFPTAFPTAPDSEQQYLAFIEQEEDSSGLTSPDLIEPMTVLAQQYYEREEYDLAFETLSRARQIMRVNHGFDTLTELPLLARLVHIDELRGNVVQAWELEDTLLALARQHIGARETLPIFRDVARKRLELRRLYLGGDRLPQIELGCYYARDAQIDAMVRRGAMFNMAELTRGSCGAGERNTVNVALLLEARSYQMLALEASLQNGGYASDELWDLLTDVLRTSDLLQRRLPLFSDPALGQLMTRLLSHEATNAEAVVRRAQILIQLADMNVVRTRQADRYSGYDAVLEQYQQAYAMLQNQNLTQAELDAIFAPARPAVLPTFFSHPLTEVDDAEATAYIDVAFDITHQGKTRDMEVIGQSENVERSDRRKLAQLIDQASFRPRLVNGKVAESAPVTMRYYVNSSAE